MRKAPLFLCITVRLMVASYLFIDLFSGKMNYILQDNIYGEIFAVPSQKMHMLNSVFTVEPKWVSLPMQISLLIILKYNQINRAHHTIEKILCKYVSSEAKMQKTERMGCLKLMELNADIKLIPTKGRDVISFLK